jgi:cytochrome c5
MKKSLLLSATVLSMALLMSECKSTKTATAKTAPKEEKAPVSPADQADVSAGQAIFTTKCDKCHRQPAPLKHDDAEWKETMSRMSVKAQLSDMETAQVLKYLSTCDRKN